MSRVWIEEDGNLILHHADLQENRPHKKYKNIRMYKDLAMKSIDIRRFYNVSEQWSIRGP